MGRVLMKSLAFFVDYTAPDVGDITLGDHGEDTLLIHSSGDLSKMDIKFSAQDGSSGLLEIKWTISQPSVGATPGAVIASDSLAAEKMTAPCAPACTCMNADASRCYKRFYDLPLQNHAALQPSQISGSHASHIVVKVEARNRAGMWASAEASVVIDMTPPLAGVVIDNLPSSPDLDFVSDGSTLRFGVKGFSDPESGPCPTPRRISVNLGPCAGTFAYRLLNPLLNPPPPSPPHAHTLTLPCV